MPSRSKISKLPEELRAELNNRLMENAFSEYQSLSDWLEENGYEISKSTLCRYGQAFQSQLNAITLATEQARAIAEVVGDDENALGDACNRLIQQKLFDVLLELGSLDSEQVDFIQLGRLVAQLNSSSVTLKKWRVEMRSKAEAKFKELENKSKSGELDAATLKAIRQEVYGLFD